MIFPYRDRDTKEETVPIAPNSLKLKNEVIILLADGENLKDWTKVQCVACNKLFAVPPGEKYIEVCESQYCQKARLDTIEYVQKQQKENDDLMKKIIGS